MKIFYKIMLIIIFSFAAFSLQPLIGMMEQLNQSNKWEIRGDLTYEILQVKKEKQKGKTFVSMQVTITNSSKENRNVEFLNFTAYDENDVPYSPDLIYNSHTKDSYTLFGVIKPTKVKKGVLYFYVPNTIHQIKLVVTDDQGHFETKNWILKK